MNTYKRQKEEYEGMIKTQGEKISKLTENVGLLENQMVKTKKNMGEVMDLVIENCQSDVVEKIYSLIRSY